jgi:hypothetical protein
MQAKNYSTPNAPPCKYLLRSAVKVRVRSKTSKPALFFGNAPGAVNPPAMHTRTSRERRALRIAKQTHGTRPSPEKTPTAEQRPPDQLPDPWLFDSEKLLEQLDKIREAVLRIPINNDKHATHFAINNAVDSICDLTKTLRYLLHLHREGQRAFAKKHKEKNVPRRDGQVKAILQRPAARKA